MISINLSQTCSAIFLIGLSMLIALRHPRKCIIGFAMWMIWFGYAFLREGESAVQAAFMRFHTATESTMNFVRQGSNSYPLACIIFYVGNFRGVMLGSWGRFLAPFVADILGFAFKVWNKISWEKRIISMFVAAVLYIVYWTYTAVRKRADAILVTRNLSVVNI